VTSGAEDEIAEDSAEVTVRLAEAGEAHLVFALMRAAFAETAAQALPSSALREEFGDSSAKLGYGPGAFAVLAFVGGRPAGSGRGRVDEEADYVTYERLAVHPGLRGQGIGGAMATFIEDHGRGHGVGEVRADARSQQPDNRPFYLKRGYRVTGYTERYGIADMRTHMAKGL